ncbi:MAG: transcriptional regulator, LacI family [Capsulimonas sp.]|jgi:DNA-binding LacI/PurR family transcriptional regulator|nr:transcriptional regulator, LacI family [Capsulimonas sp.]
MENRLSAPTRLEDIAARVGVSRSEVSRVLNGRARAGKSVGAATRDRILEAAREMNYSPHRAAQSLVSGRTNTAALMIVIDRQAKASPFLEDHDAPDELSPHYHEILGGLTYTLNEYGIHLMLAQCGGPNIDPNVAMEQIARSHTCDGLIITDMMIDDVRPAILDQTGLPYVVRGSSPQPDTVAVGMDNAAVGYEAVKYLYGLGHRRILFYNIRRELMVGQGRFEGMCRAREEFGLHATLEYRDDVHHQNGVYTSLLQRLQEPNIPTAIFAEDEISALGAERALTEAGLRVPEDVSVMTCLNARFMRLVAPHLTVLNVRLNEVASQAGHLLAKMVQGEVVERKQVFLQPILEERGSTAPPRGNS